MKRPLLIVAVLCISLMPLAGCEWLNAPPDDLQRGTDAVQAGVDAAEAEIDRLQREVDALRGTARTPEDFEMLDRVEKSLAKARSVHSDATELLADWQARLDRAPTNADLIASAAGDYANLLFPGAGVIIALAGGWFREWTKKKEAVATTEAIVQNIDAAKVPESAIEGKTKVDGTPGTVSTVTLNLTELKKLNTASGVDDVVRSARA